MLYINNKLGTKKQTCPCSRIVKKKCFGCGGTKYFLARNDKEYLLTQEIVEKVKGIITSSQGGYEKRIALFDFMESLEIGELEPKEKKRVDYLLKSRLYSELAKQSMEQYKKMTVENFGKTE